jgi:hypothetical protein
MSEDEREAVRQALLKCGSFESLLQQLARGESEENNKRRQMIEEGPYHPSDDMMYDYVLRRLSEKDEDKVLDHILTCRVCLEEVFRMRRIEDDLKEHVLEWADRQPALERLKSLVSKTSFEMFLQLPALELARHGAKGDECLKCQAGDPVVISLEAPADGYITVFHWHEETGEVTLLFPQSEDDQSRVSKGQEVSVSGEATIPVGKQGFKAIWTKGPLKVHEQHVLHAESGSIPFIEEWFDELIDLSEGEFAEAELRYEVIEPERNGFG